MNANGSNVVLGDLFNSSLSIDNSIQSIENEIREKGGDDKEELLALFEEVKDYAENTNICFKGVDGARLLYELDKRKICASSGSACSAGLLKPSKVLLAIGVPSQIARSSLRVTFGKENTLEDTKYLVSSIEEVVKELRR